MYTYASNTDYLVQSDALITSGNNLCISVFHTTIILYLNRIYTSGNTNQAINPKYLLPTCKPLILLILGNLYIKHADYAILTVIKYRSEQTVHKTNPTIALLYKKCLCNFPFRTSFIISKFVLQIRFRSYGILSSQSSFLLVSSLRSIFILPVIDIILHNRSNISATYPTQSLFRNSTGIIPSNTDSHR